MVVSGSRPLSELLGWPYFTLRKPLSMAAGSHSPKGKEHIIHSCEGSQETLVTLTDPAWVTCPSGTNHWGQEGRALWPAWATGAEWQP